MATFWMSAAGTDTASGTNFANAKKTLHASITAATGTKGNILNIVNDGTHSLTTSQNQYTGPTGTSWADFGLKIRGTDTAGVSSLADFAGIAAQANWFAYIRGGARYWIIEGLHFDVTAAMNTSGFIKYRDATSMPLKLQYCWFSQADVGGYNNITWPILDRDTTDPTGGTAELYRCYFQNVKFFVDLAISSETFILDECVFVLDTDSVTWGNPTYECNLTANLNVNKGMKNCTVLFTTDYTGVANPDVRAIMCNYPVGSGAAAMTAQNNLVAVHKTSATGNNLRLAGLCQGPVALSSADVTTSDIGNNYFAIGSNVATVGSWTNGGIYEDPWDTLATGTGVDDVMATDTLTNKTPAQVFGDPDGTYNWEVTTEYTLVIPDLRARVGTTADSAGGQVGALESFNTAPVAVADTYSITAGSTLTVAASGVLTNDTDVDLDSLTASLVTDVTTGTLTLNSDGSFTYIPEDTYEGTVTFNYKCSDGLLWSNTTTVTINVSAYPIADPDVDPPAETTAATFLDVRPFFEPTFKIGIIARHKQKVNRRLQTDIRDEIEPELYSESVHRQLDLATNTTKTINMGGIATGEYLAVQTNNPIKVAAGDASFLWPVAKMLVLAGGSFQTLTIVNESVTNAATVLLAVVD